MTIDAAFAALVDANPIPDPRFYAEHRLEPAAFLTATHERTIDMQTTDQQKSGQKVRQRKWQPLVAVAAFVLVIAVGLAAALALRGGDDVTSVPAPPFDTPQQAVEAYYTALNGGDGEAFLALFAEDASKGEVDFAGTTSDDRIRSRVESIAAQGIVTRVVSCTTETELRSNCVAETDQPGGPGAVRITAVVTIDDSGRITRIEETWPPQDPDRADAWSAWLAATEPELLKENRGLWGPDPTERSGADIGRDMKFAAQRFDAQYDG